MPPYPPPRPHWWQRQRKPRSLLSGPAWYEWIIGLTLLAFSLWAFAHALVHWVSAPFH